MKKHIYSVIGFLTIPLSISYAIAFFQCIKIEILTPILVGGITYLIIALITKHFGFNWTFISTLAHEINHLVVNLFFFNNPISIKAEGGSGEMSHEGRSNVIVRLSPYSFCLLAILIAIFYYFFSNEKIIAYIIGGCLAFHFHCLKEDFHLGQPDFDLSGKIFAICFILLANLFLTGSICMIQHKNSYYTKKYISTGVKNISEFIHGFIKTH